MVEWKREIQKEEWKRGEIYKNYIYIYTCVFIYIYNLNYIDLYINNLNYINKSIYKENYH